MEKIVSVMVTERIGLNFHYSIDGSINIKMLLFPKSINLMQTQWDYSWNMPKWCCSLFEEQYRNTCLSRLWDMYFTPSDSKICGTGTAIDSQANETEWDPEMI